MWFELFVLELGNLVRMARHKQLYVLLMKPIDRNRKLQVGGVTPQNYDTASTYDDCNTSRQETCHDSDDHAGKDIYLSWLAQTISSF